MREFVLTAEKENVIQGTIDRLSEVGRFYGIERNLKGKLR
jgi:hypothetical protein